MNLYLEARMNWTETADGWVARSDSIALYLVEENGVFTLSVWANGSFKGRCDLSATTLEDAQREAEQYAT
jgi:hypothetical protein